MWVDVWVDVLVDAGGWWRKFAWPQRSPVIAGNITEGNIKISVAGRVRRFLHSGFSIQSCPANGHDRDEVLTVTAVGCYCSWLLLQLVGGIRPALGERLTGGKDQAGFGEVLRGLFFLPSLLSPLHRVLEGIEEVVGVKHFDQGLRFGIFDKHNE